MKSFGQFLLEKRKEKSLTQKELAGMLFVTESAVCKWERDVARPDISLLPKLAEILGVTEHELITASVDEAGRKNAGEARRWRIFSRTWELFFLIAYGVTLLVCFTVDLATGGGLSWFFLVFASVLLAATFTTVPRYIRVLPVVLIPLSELAALLFLFGVICIYTGGGWFLLAAVPCIAVVVAVFFPIIAARPFMPRFARRHNALLSVALDYLLFLVMLAVICAVTGGEWFASVALPLLTIGFAVAVAAVGILRYLPCGRWLRAGFTTLFFTAVYLVAGYSVYPFLERAGVPLAEHENTQFRPFSCDFSVWEGETVSNNVTFIIFLAALAVGVALLAAGILRARKARGGK